MPQQVEKHGMVPVDQTAEKVRTNPSPLFPQFAFLLQLRRGPGLSAIFRMDKLCQRLLPPYGTHGQNRPAELVQQSSYEACACCVVRIPMAV